MFSSMRIQAGNSYSWMFHSRSSQRVISKPDDLKYTAHSYTVAGFTQRAMSRDMAHPEAAVDEHHAIRLRMCIMGIYLRMAIEMDCTIRELSIATLQGDVHRLLVQRIRHRSINGSGQGKVDYLPDGKKSSQTGHGIDYAHMNLRGILEQTDVQDVHSLFRELRL